MKHEHITACVFVAGIATFVLAYAVSTAFFGIGFGSIILFYSIWIPTWPSKENGDVDARVKPVIFYALLGGTMLIAGVYQLVIDFS